MEGNPDANASINEFGIPSYHDGRTKISDDFRHEIISLSDKKLKKRLNLWRLKQTKSVKKRPK